MVSECQKPRKFLDIYFILFSCSVPQKLATTACFIEKESLGGRQISKNI